MDNLGSQTKPPINLTNRVRGKEEKISGVEGNIEETDKENVKCKKSVTKYPGNLGHHEKTKFINNRNRRRGEKTQV